ncbi:hypothetical protein MMC09_002630 [Bachmanniomyces sp. S44760]|nr:hypothetical protein [Bachmanniomyces sp. S44760]
MSTLSYGLNVTKKPSSLAGKPAPPKRKTIFDDDSGPEDGPDGVDALETIDTLGGLDTTSTGTNSSLNSKGRTFTQRSTKKPQISQYGDLSSNHSTARHASSAQSLDPNVYDYDAVYDSLHSKPKGSASKEEDKRPKYMANLLAAAETRKRDQLRAKDKMLAKEREAEGDEYADKEKFVTGAYKAQQEEVERLEQEEAKREAEEQERKRKGEGGMTGLYRGLLDKEGKKHDDAIRAVDKAIGGLKSENALESDTSPLEPTITREKQDSDLAKAKGIALNDEGQVVDKRQLLNAGLNIAPKPKSSTLSSPNTKSSSAAANRSGPNGDGAAGPRIGSKQAMRERQSRMLEEQLEQASKRAVEDEDVKAGELERAAKSRKTEGEITGARARYLQRKKEAADAKAAGGGGG